MGPHYLDPFGHRQEVSDHPESQKGNRGITGYLTKDPVEDYRLSTVLKFMVYSTCSLAVYHIHIVHINAHTHIHVHYIYIDDKCAV